MTTKSLDKSQKDKYTRIVKNAGQWNVILGWLWVASSLFWALILFITSDTHTIFGGFGSAIISLATSTYVVIVAVNITLAILHLVLGTYIQNLMGPLTKKFLIICAVAALPFCLALLPILPALMSFYGLYAYAKLERSNSLKFKQKYSLEQFRKKVTIVGILLGLVVATSIFSLVRANHATGDSSDSSGKNKYFKIGTCDSVSKTFCAYHDKSQGYHVVFPIPDNGVPAPTLFDSTRAFGPNKDFEGTASNVAASMNSYNVSVYSFTTDTSSSVARLEQVRDKSNIFCGTNTDADPLTTYNGLPAISTTVTAISSIDQTPCHFYATTIQKGNKVYEIDALDIVLIKDQPLATTVSLDNYQAFLASFKFTD